MTRSVGADGMAEEEYDFNEEVTLAQQVRISQRPPPVAIH